MAHGLSNPTPVRDARAPRRFLETFMCVDLQLLSNLKPQMHADRPTCSNTVGGPADFCAGFAETEQKLQMQASNLEVVQG